MTAWLTGSGTLLGPLLGVMVTAADTGDRTAAKVLLKQVTDAISWQVSGP
ncbi:hypothetical protein ACIRPU_34175 [Streptomyces sp. NPDC102259]